MTEQVFSKPQKFKARVIEKKLLNKTVFWARYDFMPVKR
jgi:hypothetical protein